MIEKSKALVYQRPGRAYRVDAAVATILELALTVSASLRSEGERKHSEGGEFDHLDYIRGVW